MFRTPACQEILATKHLLASNTMLGYLISMHAENVEELLNHDESL